MQFQVPRLNLQLRLRAVVIHLAVCLPIAAASAALVFGLWFPWPYRAISGGQSLFILIVSVDLVLGPLLTFSIFDVTKGRKHLRRDLAVVGTLQLAALVYGLSIVYGARPVALVFEVDRFRVIAAADVYLPELPQALPSYQHLPLSGPWTLGTRKSHGASEQSDAIFKGLQGFDIGQRPQFWQPYELSKRDALVRARPVRELVARYPEGAASIAASLQKRGLSIDDVKFLPLMARREWVVILTNSGDIAGFEPFDGFF